MEERYGDLLKLGKAGEFDVIIHGCNCFNTMGAGIAKQVKSQFPEAYEADARTKKGDKDKLGKYTKHEYATNTECESLYVINAYTQYAYWNAFDVDYDAIRSCFKALKEDFGGQNLRFGYPLIGCGLAGGNWDTVKAIIDEELEGEDHTVVIFQ